MSQGDYRKRDFEPDPMMLRIIEAAKKQIVIFRADYRWPTPLGCPWVALCRCCATPTWAATWQGFWSGDKCWVDRHLARARRLNDYQDAVLMPESTLNKLVMALDEDESQQFRHTRSNGVRP